MPQSDLTFLHGQRVPECTHAIDKHFEGYQTLQYMAAGSVALAVGPKSYVLNGRWFWSAYPGPRIRFHAAPGTASWVHRYTAFRGPAVSRWVAEGLFPVPPQRPPGGRDFSARFDAILEYSRSPDRWRQRRAANLLEGVLIDLAAARGGAVAAEPWVDRLRSELDLAAAGANPDYAALASGLGMSVTTLRRRFRRAAGLPPHAYLLERRAAAARHLLAETDLPIKAVAERLGYHDVFFFTRQFRRQTGFSPGLYRRSCQG
jgi:AraC-like DNA-binding protein